MEEWKECKLKDICFFAKDRINVSELNNETYISTENMIPNRGGIASAATLPTSEQTPSFVEGDILVSNIRPYFKKIWKARYTGGCSADVLNFKAKENISKEYLYYVLSDDEFFKYCMTTSKGTKMPRGDKVAIMEYPIHLPPLPTQQKIAAILSSLDDKIELNNKINENLEQQAQTLFNSFFTNTDERKSFELKELVDVTNNLRERITDNNTPVFSAVNTGNLQRSDDYFSKQVYSKDISKYILGDFAYNPARINIGSIGINDFDYDGCVSPVYVAFSVDKDYRSFFKYYFKSNNFKEETKLRASGSVRQTLNYSDFAKIQIHYPPRELAKKFEDFHKNIEGAKKKINKENAILTSIRDTLLPKLMNGEIEV